MKIGKFTIPLEALALLGKDKYRKVFGGMQIIHVENNEFGHIEFTALNESFDDEPEMEKSTMENESHQMFIDDEKEPKFFHFDSIKYYLIDIMEVPIKVTFYREDNTDSGKVH